jgi:tol-pal system protein YbgF
MFVLSDQLSRVPWAAAGALAAVVLSGAATGAAAPSAQAPMASGALAPSMTPFGIDAADAAPAAPVRVHLAQSREVAQINVRLDQLEEQMRVLTGQVEALQFQLSQLQALIERMQQDYEFRFQELEGTGGGTTQTPPPSGGASGDQPTSSIGTDRLPPETPTASTNVGDSLDPMIIEPDNPNAGTLGQLPADVFEQPLPAEGIDSEASLGPSDRVGDADAQAQFNAGYDAMQRGDYEFAEVQFNQFVGLYANHRMAPAATVLLGEALLRQSKYDEAAQILVNGYEDYRDSEAAPEILLKLGEALAGAGERETACRTYTEILKRYPNQQADFYDELRAQQRSAQC